MGSALARVRWELDINQRWLRDPSFYIEQTLTGLAKALVQPPPFSASRSLVILERVEDIPTILGEDQSPPRPPLCCAGHRKP